MAADTMLRVSTRNHPPGSGQGNERITMGNVAVAEDLVAIDEIDASEEGGTMPAEDEPEDDDEDEDDDYDDEDDDEDEDGDEGGTMPAEDEPETMPAE
jgi:hypothetical protein